MGLATLAEEAVRFGAGDLPLFRDGFMRRRVGRSTCMWKILQRKKASDCSLLIKRGKAEIAGSASGFAPLSDRTVDVLLWPVHGTAGRRCAFFIEPAENT